ncbi:MAG: hypothetical protein WCT26_04315 [Candidatus Buchananbacteria bacterium]|jgi:hypothetical protein
MDCSEKIKTHYKIIISFVVALALIAGVTAWMFKYFEVFSDMSQVVSKNPIQQQVVDLAKLSETYKLESSKIFSDFLVSVGESNADISSLAKQAQNSLLALSLPAEFRQKHLAEVLLLGEIAESAAAGKATISAAKINELKAMVSN